ncbi:RDD family protein [Fictibacillus iocasae]|uniref:RDD family protein n=1 Tax=Fictibacillus iocasae TaxID=2715437 RepID=A0ABW2NU74_9BACL
MENEAHVWTLAKQEKRYHYAGFWIRFWAFLLDFAVVSSLNRFILFPFFFTENPSFGPAGIFTLEGLIAAIVLYAYYMVMTKVFSQTLGKMVFNIRVIAKEHETLTWPDLFFREVVGKFISKFLFLGYIAAAFSKRKQGFHDRFADTYVVYNKEE